MTTGYTVGGDSLQLLTSTKYGAQTFRPEQDITLHWIDLNLRIRNRWPPPLVRLYYAGGDHLPIPPPISNQKFMPIPLFTKGEVKRFRFPMFPYPLTKDFYYCITVEARFPWTYYWIDWQYDAGDATYSRGIRLSSDNGGFTWTQHPNDDHIFYVFGTPPAPLPPPEPPVEHFAILDVQQTYTLDGILFVVTTSVPCHLYMLYTTNEPEKHKTPIFRRGLALKDAIRFCFVVWKENEQAEEGDTLTHTFLKEPWAYCETRWFTFRAKVNGEWSPSVGPIFKKHRIAPDYLLVFTEPWGTGTLEGPLDIDRVFTEDFT